jgi:hypothetical protein
LMMDREGFNCYREQQATARSGSLAAGREYPANHEYIFKKIVARAGLLQRVVKK